MKRKIVFMLVAAMVFGIPSPAYALDEGETVQSSVFENKFTFLEVAVNEEAEVLTLEKAVEKALKYSSTLRNSKRDIEQLQDARDEAAEKWTYSSTNSLSEVMSIVSYDTQLINSTLSQEVTKAKLENSMKSAYITIMNTERELACKKLNLDNAKQELDVSEKKLSLGLISNLELQNQKLSYEKSQTEIENTEKTLKEAYQTLNTLLGEPTTKVYQLSLDAVYTPFTFNGDLESYINVCLNSNATVKQKKNSADLAEEKLKLYSIESGESYTSLQNNISTTSLSYRDAKAELENAVRSTYNSITTLEKSYENNLKEWEVLKSNLSVAEAKYNRQLITLLDLEDAKYQLASLENTMIGQVYEHMLLVEKFQNPDLIY